MSIETILIKHGIECTGLGEVTCRGCGDKGWMSWHAYRTHVAHLIRAELTSDEAVEAAARAMAIHDEYDGCFERVDEWEATPKGERNEYPGMAYEDCGWWRKRARAALAAAVTALGGDHG